jgi:hypothetical protein
MNSDDLAAGYILESDEKMCEIKFRQQFFFNFRKARFNY